MDDNVRHGQLFCPNLSRVHDVESDGYAPARTPQRNRPMREIGWHQNQRSWSRRDRNVGPSRIVGRDAGWPTNPQLTAFVVGCWSGDVEDARHPAVRVPVRNVVAVTVRDDGPETQRERPWNPLRNRMLGGLEIPYMTLDRSANLGQQALQGRILYRW